jgi:hypothetical protein
MPQGNAVATGEIHYALPDQTWESLRGAIVLILEANREMARRYAANRPVIREELALSNA